MNASNRIPLSVRISQEDADFIAGLNLEGANTPSEKIREILKQARLMNAQQQDYGAALNQAEQFFQTAKHEVLHAEKQLGVHSPILARVFELLPDLSATLASDLPEEADLDSLKKYEQEIMRRVVRLADSILQLAVTGRGAAYDDAVLAELENTLKLARIVWQRYEDEAV
ncbi:hypothetical protein [Neisseria zoodegmatis]|uniref:Uncharacterized protein n=1 Tax=Neisseria zoodegmatis TaxID=326523 RepID=A0AB38DTF0_9NEIS|nr:hypothetical protein [Neisseria zoodegmatis]OSI10108.1 hypothetical protein BWD10_06765 [Neisseria zoodegmatis]SNU80356.1 Uncharacterised protein [Neisseria zoodegmatis]